MAAENGTFYLETGRGQWLALERVISYCDVCCCKVAIQTPSGAQELLRNSSLQNKDLFEHYLEGGIRLFLPLHSHTQTCEPSQVSSDGLETFCGTESLFYCEEPACDSKSRHPSEARLQRQIRRGHRGRHSHAGPCFTVTAKRWQEGEIGRVSPVENRHGGRSRDGGAGPQTKAPDATTNINKLRSFATARWEKLQAASLLSAVSPSVISKLGLNLLICIYRSSSWHLSSEGRVQDRYDAVLLIWIRLSTAEGSQDSIPSNCEWQLQVLLSTSPLFRKPRKIRGLFINLMVFPSRLEIVKCV